MNPKSMITAHSEDLPRVLDTVAFFDARAAEV